MKSKIFRLILEAGLLIFVWLHAHWSVALAITGLTVNSEIDNLVTDRIIDLLEKLIEIVKQPFQPCS